MPIFGMPMSKSKDILPDSNPWWKYNFILRSKVKVIQSSWMYAPHCTMVIHSSAKQRMTMSKDKKTEVWTQSLVINPINLTLTSKVNVVSGSWTYLTHPLMVINQCAKYGMPMPNQKKLWTGPESAQTHRQTDRQTDRQSDSFVHGSIINVDIY